MQNSSSFCLGFRGAVALRLFQGWAVRPLWRSCEFFSRRRAGGGRGAGQPDSGYRSKLRPRAVYVRMCRDRAPRICAGRRILGVLFWLWIRHVQAVCRFPQSRALVSRWSRHCDLCAALLRLRVVPGPIDRRVVDMRCPRGDVLLDSSRVVLGMGSRSWVLSSCQGQVHFGCGRGLGLPTRVVSFLISNLSIFGI